ncbi:molecular chaperone [Burkholderia ubonensis]|uniref:fimbrial biogenesis chaperone n=1 Tax=Burkholderia ubonensis TaxID=101571 RepID=UPI00075DE6DF|nr:fimbria/pilus periplasmic chaperone [Burkholderia ubonensis]KVD53718.1 pilus assembly protein [Burkholderia ubonensis]KVT35634.1 pilus assembly protein [Burkholderia ubonensis]KVT84711.1 pilus assembly protein [Burkholderia ubonensis]KWC54232.1 pilus assembly protein [Burkholderia ubonensis]
MNKIRYPYEILMLLVLTLSCAGVHASVLVSGTRVVFPGSDQEVTVRLTNDGTLPSLVQTWLDNGNQTEAPDRIDVPFVITPSVFRLEPGKGQTLRILYTGESLPTDRESLFWLNVLDVPPKPGAEDDRNRIQLAIRTRIKLMYRPANLPGSTEDAPGRVTWKIGSNKAHAPVLRATNPTPYVVNLAGIAWVVNGNTFDAGMGYVLPGKSAEFEIKGMKDVNGGAGTVEFISVDDWGANRSGRATAEVSR